MGKIDKTVDNICDMMNNGWSRQVVLSGPPGTSKTYTAQKVIAKLLRDDDMEEIDLNNYRFRPKSTQNGERKIETQNKKGYWALVQFHPSYNYEDFVRGIQVSTVTDKENKDNNIKYETANKILGEMAKQAKEDKNQGKDTEYILLIDEINRAPVASVLGELIYALEYRGQAVETPYAINHDTSLIIPENLYIIATMNTADRTIGTIDYAVRRRFAFVNLLPDEEIIKEYYSESSGELKATALALYKAVASLFEDDGTNTQPAATNYLGPDIYAEDVQVGHTYFLAENKEELYHKFTYQVLPILKEYVKDGILVEKGTPSEIDLQIKIENHEKKFNLKDSPKVILDEWKNFWNDGKILGD
jgi:MoxR-like ATPase